MAYDSYTEEIAARYGIEIPRHNAVRRQPPPSSERRIIVKQNGKQKQFRINKYGEIFEE